MDVNCGTILDGEENVQQAGQRIFELILRVASGERTKSEQYRFRVRRVRALADRRDSLNQNDRFFEMSHPPSGGLRMTTSN